MKQYQRMDDDPAFTSRMDRAVVNIAVAGAVTATAINIGYGYASGFGLYRAARDEVLSHAAAILARYNDLEAFRHGYGDAFILSAMSAILFSIFTTILYLVYLVQTRAQLGQRIGRSNLGFGKAMLLWIISLSSIFFLFLMDVGVSQEKYLGTSRIFLPPIFPYLCGLSFVVVSPIVLLPLRRIVAFYFDRTR